MPIVIEFLKTYWKLLLVIGLFLGYTWYVYDWGKEAAEAKYLHRMQEQAEAYDRLVAERNALLLKRTKLKEKEFANVTGQINEKALGAKEYVKSNPKDTSCNLNADDVRLLNGLTVSETKGQD